MAAGILRLICLVNFAITFSGMSAVISGSIRPGVTVLTVIPIPLGVRDFRPRRSQPHEDDPAFSQRANRDA
jgi:hypothetical protein